MSDTTTRLLVLERDFRGLVSQYGVKGIPPTSDSTGEFCLSSFLVGILCAGLAAWLLF
jgi:hypothetical protein